MSTKIICSFLDTQEDLDNQAVPDRMQRGMLRLYIPWSEVDDRQLVRAWLRHRIIHGTQLIRTNK